MCKRLIKRYLANKKRHLLNSKSLASFYKHVNAKLSSSRGVAPLRVNNIVLVDDEEKVQAFNNYFSSVFTRPLNEINTSQLNSACPIFSNIMYFSPRLTYEALLKAKPGYSVGPDLLPSILWVKLAAQLALPVSILFNTSYHFATLPSDWKGANVLPLFKKGDPSLVSNYRPISLTSTLGKIMESMVRDNLLNFALSHGIINPNQHGFVPKRSACTQLLEAHYDWC